MSRQPRQSLNRTRVIEGAIRVADAGGVEAVTMRRVAQELGIEAMSLYHHVPNKDAILDGVVDAVFEAIDLPDSECADWRDAIRGRAFPLAQSCRSTVGLSVCWIRDAALARRPCVISTLCSECSGRPGSHSRWPPTEPR